MPDTEPFAALRYNLNHISSLSDVVAPPYDVISPDLQDTLYKKHPSNVIRIILNRDEPGDDCDETYVRAADFVRQWIQEGVLTREAAPAFYVYHQSFVHDGQTICRRGFMGRVRLQPFGSGNIYPHEETHSKAKSDRLKLTKATRQNNSQIFGLYPDPDNTVINLLVQATQDIEPIQATDHVGVEHSLWPVTAPQIIARVSELMMDRSMFVADGHHRYETACNFRDHVSQTNGPLAADHPANFVMTMLVGMSDPGLIVLPTHRILKGTRRFSSDELETRLSDYFECDKLSGGIESASDAWQRLNKADAQGMLAVYAAADATWVMLEAKPIAHNRMKEIASDRSDTWRGLGVSLLHDLVLDELLELKGHAKPTYVHDTADLVQAIQGEGSQAESESDEPCTLAAIVMPAKLSDIETISLQKERMPAKSTYFYPKLLSGLTFYPLSD